MKVLETALFVLALLTVPALGWAIGRALGRRDCRIASVLAAGAVVALAPNAIRIAALAFAEPQGFADALVHQATRTFDNPEVGLFFLALGVFMTMLGWTATPSRKDASEAQSTTWRH